MSQSEFTKVDEYINSTFSLQDKILKQVEEEIRNADIGWQNISSNQGKFLHSLAKICKAKNILEIGTFGGYSSVWLARALDNNGSLITLELDEKHANVAQRVFEIAGLQDRIQLKLGIATNSLAELAKKGECFDLIFIDADKPPYPEYLEWSLKLSKPGTLIIADNVIRHAQLNEEKPTAANVLGVRKFNKMLASHPNLDSTIIQTIGIKEADGISISIVL